jgi:V8-like Glu-specific endopeptidase
VAIQLSQSDFDRLAAILAQYPDWQTVRGRVDFMTDVLAGSPRRADLLGRLDLDGAPRGTAVRTIQRLQVFGQDEPGREALGVLINKLIANYGGGDAADFMRDVLIRYPFETQPVAARELTGWRGRETADAVAEKIIGENTLRDISHLEKLVDLARAVVRIQGPNTGTGFMISEDLLITNHHVIGSAADAQQCAFQFNYQLDGTGRVGEVQTARAREGGLWRTSPIAPRNAMAEQLDYAIVQLVDVPESATRLPLRPAGIRRDARVTIIQHPGGDYKKISMQNNFVEYADEFVVQYTTSTEPGSSGSPVLNDELEVVAIHHAGGQLIEPATNRRYLRNEGIRAAAILDDVRRNAPDIYEHLGG